MFTQLSRWLKRLTGTASKELSLPEQARKLLAQGELSAALQLLIDADSTEAILLKEQQMQALKQRKQKMINEETFRVTYSRITHALLAMLAPDNAANTNTLAINKLEDASESLPTHFTEDQCQQIRTLLLQNDYTAAMELASNWSQDGRMLYQRYQKARRDSMLGLVLEEDHLRILGQIISEITILVSPEKVRGPLSSEQQSQLRQLLEAGQWSALLTLGGEWNEHFLLLSIQYHQVETSFSKGLITKLDYEEAKKHVQQEVRKLLEEK